MRIAILGAGHAHQLEIFECDVVTLAAVDALAFEAEGDVLAHRLPREQRELLEDHGAVGTRLTDYLAADPHSAGRRHFKSGDHAQERGLTATRGTNDRDEFSLANCQVDVVERLDHAAATREHLADVIKHDFTHGLPLIVSGPSAAARVAPPLARLYR